MASIIGIDLGTTNSLCSIFVNSEAKLIPNVHGDLLTPSVVASKDGQIVVGAAARELRVTQPKNAISCFKRFMGTDKKLTLADKEFSAIELSSFILKSLKEDAQRYLEEEVTSAVITVPAYFNDHQRQATKLAGKLAGLEVKRIINEPTAAALVYGFHDKDQDRKLMVIDLGGGTFDVTIMETYDGVLEIVSTAGENFLGGEDFTEKTVAWLLEEKGLNFEREEFDHPQRVARLTKLAENAKRELNTASQTTIYFPSEDGQLSDDHISLSREQFKTINTKLLQRISATIARAMRDAECLPDEIDAMIFVGGATRMQVLQDFIKNLLKKDFLVDFDPDQVVALGASIQAALILDDAAVEDIVMTDVCPFTLGTEIVKEFGRGHEAGYFLPVIHRNTVIPVAKEEVVYTLHDNQQNVTIAVFQGESRKVAENFELGKIEITDLPSAPSGLEVKIRFAYDLNGILEVEIIIPKNGKRYKKVLTNHVKNLSEAEISLALEKMQEIKFFPSDQKENLRLLQFAEAHVGEVNKFHRDGLEEALDRYQAALTINDAEIFELAKASLKQCLSSLEFPYSESQENSDEL